MESLKALILLDFGIFITMKKSGEIRKKV